jgi:hypothetical protein
LLRAAASGPSGGLAVLLLPLFLEPQATIELKLTVATQTTTQPRTNVRALTRLVVSCMVWLLGCDSAPKKPGILEVLEVSFRESEIACARARSCIRDALPDPFDPALHWPAFERASGCITPSVAFGCSPIDAGRHAENGRRLSAHLEQPTTHPIGALVLAYADGTVDEETCRCLGAPAHTSEGYEYLRCYVVDHEGWRAQRTQAIRAESVRGVDWHAYIGRTRVGFGGETRIRIEFAPPRARRPASPPQEALDLADVRLHKNDVTTRYRVVDDARLRPLFSPASRTRLESLLEDCGVLHATGLSALAEVDWDMGTGPGHLGVPDRCAPAVAKVTELFKTLRALPESHACDEPIEVPFGGARCLPEAHGAPYLGLRVGTQEIRVLGRAHAQVFCSDLQVHRRANGP